jgi:hypothetical protein
VGVAVSVGVEVAGGVRIGVGVGVSVYCGSGIPLSVGVVLPSCSRSVAVDTVSVSVVAVGPVVADGVSAAVELAPFVGVGDVLVSTSPQPASTNTQRRATSDHRMMA